MKQKERIAKNHRPRETMDGHDMKLFKLSAIKSQQHLNTLENTETLEEELSDEEGVVDEQEGAKLRHMISISYLMYLDYSGEELSDSSRDFEDKQQKMDANSTDNPLIVTLDDQKGSKGKRAAHVWFQKSLFAKLEDDRDMDTEVELSLRKLKSKGSYGDNWTMVKSSTEDTTEVEVAEVKDVDVSDTDTDNDSIDSYEEQASNSTKAKNDTFEVVPVEKSLKRPRYLDPA